MNILDGKKTSELLISQIKDKISEENLDITMAIVLVGNNPASETYVKYKIKAADKAGIKTNLIKFDSDISEEIILNKIHELNNSDTTGIIVQLPLPPHINDNKIIESILPEKDIDGFHPINFGRMALGKKALRPATPYGICKLLQHYKIETKGKHIVIIGRSNIVGKPLAVMLGNEFDIGKGTVTSCQIHTPKELLKQQCLNADIIIVAVGKEKILTQDMVKENTIVIDVGINRNSEGKIVGDVDFENVSKKCSYITPVPGGVGPMTIAGLIINTYIAAKKEINYRY
jgi:methylenetetrahydrofolate dehydrogenase (NADP+)/methenyltetrahydrofolate cyclohydrolase